MAYIFKKTHFIGIAVFLLGTISAEPRIIDEHTAAKKKSSQVSFNELGQHVIAEFIGCENLDDFDNLKATLQLAAETAGATVLHVHTHKFSPQGMTGVAVLSESHISVHTWPEFGYAAVDAFTCGSHVHVQEAIKVLQKFFKPQNIKTVVIARGYSHKNFSANN